MAGLFSYFASSRGQVNNDGRNLKLSKLVSNSSEWKKKSFSGWAVLFILIGLSVSSSTALPHRIRTDTFDSHGNERLEQFLTPEDTLEMIELLRKLDQRIKLQHDLKKHSQQNKYAMAENVSKGANKHGPKFSRIQIPSNGNIDYEDFPEGVPFLQLAGSENDNIYGTPKKRYLGIDIPDYISSGSNPLALKNMSSRLKALGKRRRR